VRIIVGRAGRVVFETDLVLRFNYGANVPWVNRLDDGTLNAIAGPERLVLRTPAALYGEDLKTVGELTVEAGQLIPFVLSYGSSFQTPPPIDPFRALQQTEAFWRQWSGHCPRVGPWTEAVKRSLITLKALTYAPTGGIVASTITLCKGVVRKPESYLIYFRAVMTWVCSPRIRACTEASFL
jgi:GH15 family glucan-1,4-alpha-glucosidase